MRTWSGKIPNPAHSFLLMMLVKVSRWSRSRGRDSRDEEERRLDAS
jgi:hypothetical protein